MQEYATSEENSICHSVPLRPNSTIREVGYGDSQVKLKKSNLRLFTTHIPTKITYNSNLKSPKFCYRPINSCRPTMDS